MKIRCIFMNPMSSKYISNISSFLLFLIGNLLYSQNYSLNNGFINGSSITTCTGNFFDSNPAGNYGSNEDYSVTFCSGSPGKVIQILFSSINISSGDTLYVYDGTSTSSSISLVFTGVSNSLQYITPSAANLSGCITLRFVSNSSIESSGWVGQIRCIFPCTQSILGSTFSLPLQDTFGNANICFGDSVKLGIQTFYPDNNLNYQQNDSTSLFHWYFGDGRDSIGYNLKSLKHSYKISGGYYARVSVTDSNGCSSVVPFKIPVRTSIRPHFNMDVPKGICLFDTLLLQPRTSTGVPGYVDMPVGSFLSLPVSGDSVFLPDEPPKCFTSTILVDQFLNGQTLNNINDLKGIFMTMEHSYLGDISIAITAPNGVRAVLKGTVGGTAGDGTFLGEPVDESLNGGGSNPLLTNIIGKGYEYVFNSNPQYGTMWNESSKYTYSFTDNAAQYALNHYYLPAGSYTAEQNLSSLLGTPLNGSWVLEICDKQAYDNGFLFNWKIEFDQSIIPNSVQYTVPIITQDWLPANGLINVSNAVATVSPAQPGTYAYRFRVTDGFGCMYDTIVKVVNNRLPVKPRLGNDKTICVGDSTLIYVANPQPTQIYKWSTSAYNTDSIIITDPDIYWVKAIDTNGCVNIDTIEVFLKLPFKINLGNDTIFCASKPNVLAPESLMGIVEWRWNTGDSSTSITIPGPGTYWIQGTNTGGCGVRDSIIVYDNPINSFSLPGDTSICDKSGFNLTINPPLNSSVVWQNGRVGNSSYIESGKTYSIVASLKGCLRNSSMKANIKPLPVINLGADTTLCKGYDLPLKVSYPGASYFWNMGSKDSFLTATNKGLYWVEATYNGCLYRDSITFSQKNCDCDIIMPTAFSPNGDGVNDVYHPYIKCFPRNYQLAFFNRYGQQVFSSKDYKTLWDGKLNNSPLPSGTYYYILNFFNEDLQRNERRFGNVTIIR